MFEVLCYNKVRVDVLVSYSAFAGMGKVRAHIFLLRLAGEQLLLKGFLSC